jgi:anti-sigma regulatory factor (Ser/Thr protein kinase)
VRDPIIDDIELVVSELVTNAVLHARSATRLTIEGDDDRVRITVADDDPAPPRLRDYGTDAVTGRGVYIVDRLVDDWGVEPLGDTGKRVWCEVALAADGERSTR